MFYSGPIPQNLLMRGENVKQNGIKGSFFGKILPKDEGW